MTAKEYLLQARTLDMRIKSKLQQIESLNDLATSCTVVYSDMPRNPNRGGSKIERAVLKIIEVEESLKHDVENLANAIILQAAKDYRLTDDEQQLQEIERFFRSGWFGVLSKVDPEFLIKELRKEKRNDR